MLNLAVHGMAASSYHTILFQKAVFDRIGLLTSVEVIDEVAAKSDSDSHCMQCGIFYNKIIICNANATQFIKFYNLQISL